MSVPQIGPLKWLHVNYHNGFALKAARFFIYNLKKLFWLVSLCLLLLLLLRLFAFCLALQIRNRGFTTPRLSSILAALFRFLTAS